MCGIGTYKSEKPLSREDIARIVDYSKKTDVRGGDAFGVYNTVRIYKAPVTAHGFWRMVEEFNLWGRVFPKGIRQVIWHNRAATSGSPLNNCNNHPLESRNFILVHNGAVANAAEYRSEYPKYTEVDSYSILVCLERAYERTGDVEKAFESLSDLVGTVRVIVYDKNTRETYAYTNSGEVLYREAGEYIVVMSEPLVRARLYVEASRWQHGRRVDAELEGFSELRDNVVYKITPDLELEEVAEVEVEEHAVYYPRRGYYVEVEDYYEEEMAVEDLELLGFRVRKLTDNVYYLEHVPDEYLDRVKVRVLSRRELIELAEELFMGWRAWWM